MTRVVSGRQVTYQRLGHVLRDLAEGTLLAGQPLLDVAFGVRAPELASRVPVWQEISGKRLDPSQRAAVDLVLAAKDVALIHGPPGAHSSSCPALAPLVHSAPITSFPCR
jgi:hypothetical protein